MKLKYPKPPRYAVECPYCQRGYLGRWGRWDIYLCQFDEKIAPDSDDRKPFFSIYGADSTGTEQEDYHSSDAYDEEIIDSISIDECNLDIPLVVFNRAKELLVIHIAKILNS